jgi:hypothetical protein
MTIHANKQGGMKMTSPPTAEAAHEVQRAADRDRADVLPSHGPQSHVCTTLHTFDGESLMKYTGPCISGPTARG